MFGKRVSIFFGILFSVFFFFQGCLGKSTFTKGSANSDGEKGGAPSSQINESQQTIGSSSGFVNSTAEGDGTPHSAVAYAWQGGQTSASGSQTAIANAPNSTSETIGTSGCQQGYLGNASGANAISIGNALCNATNTQSGSHSVEDSEKKLPARKGKPGKPHQQHSPAFHPAKPQVISMNNAVGQIGEGQSGQTHNSLSNAGGLMGILAGGFANMPQGSMTFQSSAFDSQGKPVVAQQDLLTDDGSVSEEQTLISVSGNQVGHNSGGMAHVFGLGNNFNSSYNSHAPDDDSLES